MPQSARKRSRATRPSQTVSTPSPHSAVENCPAEIWSRIFSEACMDDGSTGRSLSLVSKYIRDTSKPYKYQCLFVEERQLRLLVSTLKMIPLEFRRVRHLFLSSKPWASNHIAYLDGEFFNTDKNRLLILVSSTLQTLEVGSFNADLYLAFQMPALLDLTLHGFACFKQPPSRHIVCYPQLQRLHITCIGLKGVKFMGRLDSIAPQMRELRVSLSHYGYWSNPLLNLLRDEFTSALETPRADHSKTATSSPFSIQKIIFQPYFPDLYYPYDQAQRDALIKSFRQMRRDGRFVLLTENLIHDSHFLNHHPRLTALKGSWEACRAGSRDCWNPPDYEIDTD
jgi:hypothetical protein